jgi:creatinine amidohydrolase
MLHLSSSFTSGLMSNMQPRKFAVLLLLFGSSTFAQNLSVHWEELTGPDFAKAIQKGQGTCILPFGIIEKHGPQLPLGTDLINVRYVALHAAQQEYSIIFPAYYFGQIFEAKHEPGTVAYSEHLQMELLHERAWG